MMKGKYFRDELRKMFIGYAIVPAVIFTLVCGFVFMVALMHGKKSGNRARCDYVAGELERVLTGYESELSALSKRPELFMESMDTGRSVELFDHFYRLSNELGYGADLFLLDRNRQPILLSREEMPDYLEVKPDILWGLFEPMERRPKETAVRLTEGWKTKDSDIAMGKAVTKGEEIVGYVIFVISGHSFQSVLDSSDTQIVITDRFGWGFLSSNYNFLDSSNQILPEIEQAGRYLSFDHHMYLVSKRPVYHRLYRVYAISDIQNIVVSLAMGSALVISALILMTVFVLISTKRVTEEKTRDLYRILDVLEAAKDGNLDSMIQIESSNEFRVIADAYNETIAGLKSQMENNRKMAELVASSQNKQLESQFNPHFLYNTLENIRYMCRIEPSIAEKMVFCLSGLLRYSLDTGKTEVTLKEDLQHLENYLTILKYRFNRRFSYVINVEPEALCCRIPKLVLQPMIENSVKYGFGQQENLTVELKAYVHEGKLIMICRDDGVGITPAALSELTALLAARENKSRHFGLYNIHRRIEILYGRPYGVEIRSTEGHGTTLVVTLPAHTEESEC